MSEDLNHTELKEEYSHSVALYKHYATIQFAQLTVFLLLMINATQFFFGSTCNITRPYSYLVPAIFSILSLFFFVMHWSHSFVGEKFLDRSIQIEEIINYKLYSKIRAIGNDNKPMNKYSIRPTKAILRTLYIFGIIYWFVVFLNKVIDM